MRGINSKFRRRSCHAHIADMFKNLKMGKGMVKKYG